MRNNRDTKGRFVAGHSYKRPKMVGVHSSRWARVTKECFICHKEIVVKRCRVKDKNYCSRRCASDGFKGFIPWNYGTAKISTENELVRKSSRYKLWRSSVYKRDNYTCQNCFKKGGRLNADHIKPFSIYKELRFSIDNGRTLCVDCHRKTPTYGWGAYHIKKQHEKI